MKIAQIVKPAHASTALRSGAEQWEVAVVVSMEPFVLVSPCATMKWSTLKAESFQVVGACPAHIFNKVVSRLDPEEQIRLPQGESFMNATLGNGLTLMLLGLAPMTMDLVKKNQFGDDNPTYGWFFNYVADAGWWKTYRKGSDQEIATCIKQAEDGIVLGSNRGKSRVYKTFSRQDQDFDAALMEHRSVKTIVQAAGLYDVRDNPVSQPS
jgi:hypothetical protein